MKHTFTCFGIGVLLIAVLAVTGCLNSGQQAPSGGTNPQNPAGAPATVNHIVVNETLNGAAISVNRNNAISLMLMENPTTGYSWNLTTSSGIVITNDTYMPSDTSGKLVGSGGTRIWEMTAVQSGQQTINAIYIRPWEPITGNETTFSLAVNVR
jgi:inhibitor of cysteine peptidase